MPKTRKFKDKELKVIDGKRDAWIGGIQVHAGLEKKESEDGSSKWSLHCHEENAVTQNGGERKRGRGACIPQGIPVRGWFDILWRIKDQTSSDSLSLVAAIVASVLWLLVSIGFSLSVENFGNYNKVYGALGALIVFVVLFIRLCFDDRG